MTVGNQKINIEIAQTPAEREQGLSNRDSLAENQGMLFIFEAPGLYGFWMKDMNFPLDFIWIRDGKVVEILPNVPTHPLDIYKPTVEVDSVLEVSAGWSAKNGIKVGDSADLTK